MMAAKEAVVMTPTSNMPLDDIIRELEAQRDRAHEAMLQFVVDGVKSGRLNFTPVDPSADGDYRCVKLHITGRKAFGVEEDAARDRQSAFMNRRMELGSDLDDADDTLRRALDLRDALKCEED